MSREETRTAINEMLDDASEVVLSEVFNYLSSVRGNSTESVTFSQSLRTILTEDGELLKKLAQ